MTTSPDDRSAPLSSGNPVTRAYRYKVDLLNSQVTPLASLKAFWGQNEVRVLNISYGGLAMVVDREVSEKIGDIISLSVSIRDHAFPIQVEIRGINGLKLHCAFIDPAKTFQSALKEFLKPKYLGESLERNAPLSHRPDVLQMVPTAQNYEAFIGVSETAVFVWTNTLREVQRFVAVHGEFVLEWNVEGPTRLKTGQRKSDPAEGGDDEPDWHRAPEESLLNHFADIMLAWLRFDGAPHFVDRLTATAKSDAVAQESESPLVFPFV